MEKSTTQSATEEWLDRNVGHKSVNEANTKDFDEELEKIRSQIEAFNNDLVKENAQVFLASMLSAHRLATIPLELLIAPYLESVKQHAIRMYSPSEQIAAGFADAIRTAFLKYLEPNNQNAQTIRSSDKVIALVKSLKEKDVDEIKRTSRVLIIDVLESKPEYMDWYDQLQESALCSIWTSYEVLTGDLWEDLVNESRQAAQNVCRSEKAQDSLNSKKIDLDILFEHDLDLSNKMGTILKSRFDFTSTGKINAAYDACFGIKKEKKDPSDSVLFQIEQRRHLILHKAGIVDKKFLKNTRGDYEVGQRLKLSLSELGKYMEDIFEQGFELLQKTEDWLNKNPTKV